MKLKLFNAKRVLGVAILAASVFAACSGGGGGSSPAPIASAGLGGIGPDIPFNQKVNFTVIVPPAATTSAVAAARRKRRAISATNTNPYVSPNIASLSLQVGTVNGQSPRLLPPLETFAVSCPGTSGCSVPIQNIPAAKGVDRFAVQTFSGPGGTGNIVSSGFIDVTVPSAQSVSFGGTSLTIGGFVASLSLALSVPGGTFFYGTPANGSLDVNAIDPAGAIIIGSDQLASPITVALSNVNAGVGGAINTAPNGAFALNTLQQVALQQPAQPITVAYSGTILSGEIITASTVDENSQPVSTSIPIPLTATPEPPTPVPAKPTPVPVTKPPLSLYVYDGQSDRMIEYGGINEFESGQPFNSMPRRVFDIAVPSSLNSVIPSCSTPIIADFAVSSAGAIYAQTSCSDVTFTQGYVFTYAATTQEVIPPQASPTPPVPSSSFPVSLGFTPYGQGIKLDEAHSMLDVGFTNSQFAGNEYLGLPISGIGSPAFILGSSCLQEIGFSNPCQTDSSYAYSIFGNFALDANGKLVIPAYYTASDLNGNSIYPPGDPTQIFSGEPTVLYVAPSQSAVPSPISAFAGVQDELGATYGSAPNYVAVEGSTLYTLQPSLNAPIQTEANATNPAQAIWPGLSGCPIPSASAVPDSLTSACADGAGAAYLTAFANATQTLSAHAGTNVITSPTLMVGGDTVGNFGSISAAAGGDSLAVRDGYAYVIKSGSSGSEIDIYNLNGFTGYHTDIAPVAKVIYDSTISPFSIAVGPSGTATGGQAILRRPARVHHDVKAYFREIQRRRAAHLHRRAGL